MRAASRNTILALLVVSICINYIDRANLSAAAKELSDGLSLDPREMGLLFSAFFISYAAFQIPSGWLIDRFNVYWVYAVGYFIWSSATALTGVANSYWLILGLRLLLGMAEACAYPSYSKIIASNFSESSRGLPNALIDAGSKLGPWLGLLIGGNIVAAWGWRAMFFSIGGISLVWLLPWCLAIRGMKDEATVRRSSADSPSIGAIFALRSAWGSFLGLMCVNYAWYFMLTWLPSYLQRERHFSQQLMSNLGSVPFLAVAVTSTLGGWLSDRLIRNGGSVNAVRKGFASGGLFAAMCLLLPGVAAVKEMNALVFITLACGAFGFCTSNVWAITQTLAGSRAAGKWTGVQNTFGNLSGIAAPYITGWIVKETGSFYWALVLVAVALFVGSCSFLFIVGRLQEVTWDSPS